MPKVCKGLRTKPRAGRPRQKNLHCDQRTSGDQRHPAQTQGCHALERAAIRQGRWALVCQRATHLAEVQPHRVETFTFSRDPEFDTKLADIRGALSGRAGAGVGAVRGRKVADSSAQPHPAGAADVARTAGTHDPRLHSPRHHQPVCRSGSRQRKVHGRCFKRHTHLESIAFLESLVRRLTKTGVAPDLRQLPEPIRILRSDSGSPLTRASTFISPRPAPLGSTWWNAGSHRLPVRFTTTTGPVDLKMVGILVPRNGTPSARK